jgi:DmsE family decaheme c-type cytochrome
MLKASSRLSRPFFWGLLLALVLGAAAASGGDKASPGRTPQQKDLSQYIGAESCKGCHEEVYNKFEPTPHWKTMLDKRRGPEWQGCEACHGPGMEHMSTGGDKTKIFNFKGASTKKIAQTCLQCHQYGEEQSNYARSAHNTNNVSCLDCHSVHKAKDKQYLLAARQPQLCYACHQEVRPEFSKPFRHRVNESLLKCTDCHNQHGGFLTKGLRTTSAQDVVCFKCHVEKAGPFVFEHAVVQTEGCMACHVPHGSSNPRLLRRAQVNLLCLECHTLTGGGLAPIGPTHDQSQKYQACTMCHITVHGSNFSSVFFK